MINNIANQKVLTPKTTRGEVQKQIGPYCCVVEELAFFFSCKDPHSKYFKLCQS